MLRNRSQLSHDLVQDQKVAITSRGCSRTSGMDSYLRGEHSRGDLQNLLSTHSEIHFHLPKKTRVFPVHLHKPNYPHLHHGTLFLLPSKRVWGKDYVLNHHFPGTGCEFDGYKYLYTELQTRIPDFGPVVFRGNADHWGLRFTECDSSDHPSFGYPTLAGPNSKQIIRICISNF